jgi:AcrR family transcriptional regulator
VTELAKLSGKLPDRRIGKTRDALASALFALMNQEDWNAISVQAICDKANVARASFYAHFDSKIMLLDHVIERNVGRVDLREDMPNGGDALAVLDWLIDHVSSNRSLFSKIALVPEAVPVLSRFKAAVARQFAQALAREGAEVTSEQLDFILGGTFDVLISWSKTWRVPQIPALKSSVRDFAGRILDISPDRVGARRGSLS